MGSVTHNNLSVHHHRYWKDIRIMVTVTKEHKKKWGSQFSDRDNSFDDDEDIKFFIQHTTTDRGLQSLILRNLPEIGNY